MNQLENEPLFQNDGTFSFWLFVMPVIHAAMWVMVQPKEAGFQRIEPEGFISLFWKSSFKKKKIFLVSKIGLTDGNKTPRPTPGKAGQTSGWRIGEERIKEIV